MAETMKLKPCPFCGSEPQTYMYPCFTIYCGNPDCRLGVRTAGEEKSYVVQKWNTRAEEPTEGTAHWNINCDGYYPFCSACGKEPPGREMSKYCPNCGCKMVTRGHEDT